MTISAPAPSTPVTIRLLVDNEAMPSYETEHGLSFWIEADGKRTLFDTGEGKTLLANAAQAQIDLAKTDALVISHGHYDHTGGIPQLLASAPHLPIYAHPAWLRPRYSIRNQTARPIHVQEAVRQRIEALPEGQFHPTSTITQLTPNIKVTGTVVRRTDFENRSGPFYLDPDGREEDPLEDDMVLWIDTPQGLVICVGCSHAGVLNMIHHILSSYPTPRPIRALLGGFHLHEASEERIDQTVSALQAFQIPLMMPCHCTGSAAFEKMCQAFGSAVIAGGAGKELVFD